MVGNPFLTSIRLATAYDAPGIAAIYDPICRETPISFETEAPGPDEMARRLEAVLVRLPWLVCVRGDEVLGYASAKPYNDRPAYQWTLEASIYVAEASRGQGVARALYTALFEIVTAQGYHAISAGITLPNEASVRLHAAFGFEPIGVFPAVGYKHGAWHDVGYWRRVLKRQDAAPAPTISLSELVGGPAWQSAIAKGMALLSQSQARLRRA